MHRAQRCGRPATGQRVRGGCGPGRLKRARALATMRLFGRRGAIRKGHVARHHGQNPVCQNRRADQLARFSKSSACLTSLRAGGECGANGAKDCARCRVRPTISRRCALRAEQHASGYNESSSTRWPRTAPKTWPSGCPANRPRFFEKTRHLASPFACTRQNASLQGGVS